MVPFTSEMRFRCVVCGGVGALDDVEVFSTYDEIPIADAEDDPLRPRRRGRPPVAMPRQTETGVDAALSRIAGENA